MRIGYGKLGRSWNLSKENMSTVGGDIDCFRTVQRLAHIHTNHDFILLGRNSGEHPTQVGLPKNVFNPWGAGELVAPKVPGGADKDAIAAIYKEWFDKNEEWFTDVDAYILWIGQHGTSNMLLPKVGSESWDGAETTLPHVSFLAYCGYLLMGVNAWQEIDNRREPIWLCPDPRNFFKLRDLKWPLRYPLLAQFNQERAIKHERFGDPRHPSDFGYTGIEWEGTLWVAEQKYTAASIELLAVPPPNTVSFINTEERPKDFGILINENRRDCTNNRLEIMMSWVLKNFPDCEVYGTWTEESQKSLGRSIEPLPYSSVYEKLSEWKATLTTPASGSGWATAKPWECFASGTVCFFHPAYDTQGHVIPVRTAKASSPEVAELRDFLRLTNPQELKTRVARLSNDFHLWKRITFLQRDHLIDTFRKTKGGTHHINKRLEEAMTWLSTSSLG